MRKAPQLGFSLIELMVVVAIIGILTAIAYPQYQNYIIRGHRANGQQFLMDLAQRQEQFLTDARQYAATLADLNLAAMPPEVAQFYQAPVIAVNAAGERPYFTMALVPTASLMTNDGRLIINSRGQKWREPDSSCTITGTPGTGCLSTSGTAHAWD